jgi:hypothetical protein
MNVNRIAAVVVALVALLIVPTNALAAKKGPDTAAAPSGCATQTYQYDSGGTPGSGPANDPLFARQWALDQVNAPEHGHAAHAAPAQPSRSWTPAWTSSTRTSARSWSRAMTL